MVVGSEVGTDFGGSIDLLCIGAVGDLVVVELKRDKTPREITAQALVVGSGIDESSERIIRYLAETHGVNVNAATFQYFELPDGHELLARVFLVDPSEVDLRASKRQPNLSYEQLARQATEAEVADLYLHAGGAPGWRHRRESHAGRPRRLGLPGRS